jgi:2-desacetyl-2-hydroxyethyl bacteriochlorophyllide A dehydrogenase
MKAAVLKGAGEIRIEERPAPKAGPGEVLVRIRASGICGSDIHGFEGKIPDRRPLGIIMGHEAAGDVAEVGAQAGGFKAGDRVAINPLIPCFECYACRRGWFQLCEASVTLGSAMRVYRDGTMCEFVPVPYRQLYHLPAGVSYQAGATTEPAGNAVHLLNRGALEVGSVIAVFGTGAIGLLVVQAARLAGVRKVIAVDVNSFRLGKAKELGADVIVNARERDPVQVIREETDGRGADLAVEAAGFSATYRQCAEAVRKRGKVIALGFAEQEATFPMRIVIYRELSIIGSTGFTHEFDTTLSLIASGKLNPAPVITHTFPLEEAQKAFQTAADPKANAIKVMVIP